MPWPAENPTRHFPGLHRPHRLSPTLQSITGLLRGTRIEVMKAVWKYIKNHNLQDPRDKRYFFPDAKFVPICGPGRCKILHVTKYLTPHLRATNSGGHPNSWGRMDNFGPDDLWGLWGQEF